MNKTRKTLSFDVGIKNLAYCLLEINDDDQTFAIIKWDIIDLVNDRKLCNHKKRNGKFCDSVGTKMIKFNDHSIYYYCKSHITKAKFNIHDVDVHWDQNKSENIEQCVMCNNDGIYICNLLEGQYCKNHCKTATKKHNLLCSSKSCKCPIDKGLYLSTSNSPDINDNQLEIGWCIEHFTDGYDAYLKKKTKNISQNCNNISLCTLGTSMFEQLDKIPEFLQVDEILVENQPTFINPKMKSVSALLYSYFIMRGIVERDKTNSTISNVTFCSPSNKIKVGGKIANNKLENTDKEKVYKITKNLSVKFCKALIDDNINYVNLLNDHKKKDDLADAFLQGIIMNFPKLPDIYADKINSLDIDDISTKNKTTHSKTNSKKFYSKRKKF